MALEGIHVMIKPRVLINFNKNSLDSDPPFTPSLDPINVLFVNIFFSKFKINLEI